VTGPQRIDVNALNALIAANLIAVAEEQNLDLGGVDESRASQVAEVILTRAPRGFAESEHVDASVAFIVGFDVAIRIAARVISSPLSIDPQCLASIFAAKRAVVTPQGDQ
jgi:hypothetical protein